VPDANINLWQASFKKGKKRRRVGVALYELDLVAVRGLRERVHVLAGRGIAGVRGLPEQQSLPVVVEVVDPNAEVPPAVAVGVLLGTVVVRQLDAHRRRRGVSGFEKVVRERIRLPAAVARLRVLELPAPEADRLVGVADANHRVIETPVRPDLALDEFDLVAVGVLYEGVVVPAGFGVSVVVDAARHQLPVGRLQLADSDRDVAPGVADLDVLLVVVARQLQEGLVVAHVRRAEVDDTEPVAVVSVLLLVFEVRLVPPDGLLEVADAQHRVIKRSGHVRRVDAVGQKRSVLLLPTDHPLPPEYIHSAADRSIAYARSSQMRTRRPRPPSRWALN